MTDARSQTTPTTGARSTQRPGARRTLLALAASGAGVLPLMSLLNDARWLFEAWLAMAVVVVPAALLRIRRAPGALDIWPGIFLLIPWLTWMYLSDNAWHGFVPTGATFTDISHLMSDLHDTTSNEVAPIHSTVAARLVISALLGLLAALIDLIAVVGRRGALAGVPLLIVYTVSGAIPRNPVNWLWFAVAAAGYLVLLALDAADELLDWGRRVSRAGSSRSRPGLAFSAQRIGVIAVIAAIALPLLVPDDTRNLLADAFHDKNGGGLGSIGATGGGGTSISPYIELKGQLDRDKPVQVMTVHVDAPDDVQPFYVRLNVLDQFTGDGWRPGPDHGLTEPVSATSYQALPPSGQPETVTYRAVITITGLAGNVPIFNSPVSMSGLDTETTWSPQDQLLLGSDVRQGQQITEVVSQPTPTIAQLRAESGTPQGDLAKYLALPALPNYVTNLVTGLTSGKATSFDRAQAIFRYFADPKNNFQYSLQTAVGDSGSDLVDFLVNKRGFCQQYAGAMAVMLRAANVPARIVLGYMHLPPDGSGNFGVSTFDAHSWVEAYFPGAGWIPFDPTPTAGLAGGKKTDLPWAPHSYSSLGGSEVPSVSNSNSPGATASQSSSGTANASQGASGGGLDLALVVTLLVIGALFALALVPALVRWSRRRSRLGAARRGDTDALWAELSDTAVDLGYVWSEARSPRQVASWLAGDAGDAAPALSALATAVEHGRYARDGERGDGAALSDGLIAVTDRLWSRRSGRIRLQARLWPASLGWGRRMERVRGVLRRH